MSNSALGGWTSSKPKDEIANFVRFPCVHKGNVAGDGRLHDVSLAAKIADFLLIARDHDVVNAAP